jgi:exo-beta-1,3-glucanase (GH17 family)
MGADKNSSQRMNLAYAPNSQPRIPTRICQGRVVPMDLATLGINPNSKQHKSTTQEAKDLSNLHSLGRTVRMEGADCPRGHGGPSETRTSNTAP